jgi:hypothetical protein
MTKNTSSGYVDRMAIWPSFSFHLAAAKPAAAMESLLLEVADLVGAPTDPATLLREFFGGDPTAARLAPLVVGLDHVGAIAPVGATIADAESALLSSPFRHESRRFHSRILAADLSERLGHAVRADVTEARTDGAGRRGLGFEWFVTDLPGHELEGLIRAELGCHVALRLSPGIQSGDVHRVLGEPTGGRVPTVAMPMRKNAEIGIRLLYLERPDESGRVRRLELLDDA